MAALPFVLSKDDAIRHAAPLASASKGNSILRSLLTKYLPDFKSEPPQPDDLLAIYIPVWFVDGEVTGRVTMSGDEVREMVMVQRECGFTFS